MTAPWKKTKSTSVAKDNRKDTVLEELHARFKQVPQINWPLVPNPEPLDLQKKGNIEEDLIESPVPAWQRGKCRRHIILCLWREAATLVERTREASSFTLRRLRVHPISDAARDKTSNIERQQQTKQSTAAVRQCQGPQPNGCYKRCQNRKHQKGMDDGIWTLSIAKVFNSNAEPDETAKPGTTSRPRRTSRTIPSANAPQQNEKHFGAVGGSQISTRRVVQKKKHRIALSLSNNPGTLSQEKNERDIGRTKTRQTTNLHRSELEDMAQLIFHLLGMESMAIVRMMLIEPVFFSSFFPCCAVICVLQRFSLESFLWTGRYEHPCQNMRTQFETLTTSQQFAFQLVSLQGFQHSLVGGFLSKGLA